MNIHDMWLIEEKAIILRSLRRFRPPIAPTTEDKIAVNVIRYNMLGKKVRYEIKNIGASFWIVRRINAWGQNKPSITWGNQKWRGAAPNFINKDKAIKVYEILTVYIYKDLDIIKIVEARAWTRKYLIAASVKWEFSFVEIRGIKDSRLSSKPNHAPNQEVEEIERREPVRRVKKNRR